jgi:hypothetical protein
MKASTKAIRFLETLAIPEGPKAGQLIKLAPFQKSLSKVRRPCVNGIRSRRKHQGPSAKHRKKGWAGNDARQALSGPHSAFTHKGGQGTAMTL